MKLYPFSLFFLVIALIFVFFTHSPTQAMNPSPSRAEVCAIVKSMPNAKNTTEFLSLLKKSPSGIIKDLNALKSNMEQYDAEKYGWTSLIDSPGGLEPRPGAWLMGALRMACEP